LLFTFSSAERVKSVFKERSRGKIYGNDLLAQLIPFIGVYRAAIDSFVGH
jgi:hypothetical protein